MKAFTITIRGPGGIVLDAEIDETLRVVRRLALDDEELKALLVVTSVMAGTVEAELLRAGRRESGPAAAGTAERRTGGVS